MKGIATIAKKRLAGLLLAILAATLALAPATAAPRRSAAVLVNQLVLSSAVMRQAFEQRAAQEQFAIFQKWSIAEQKLSEALLDANTIRTQQADLQRQLDEAETQLQTLVDQLEAKDQEFARRHAALRAEMQGVVAAASPEKLALLERFAAGDRSVAYDRIVEISYAENAARQEATTIANVENLKNLYVLTQEMTVRGQRTIVDLTRIAQDIARLEPQNVASAQTLMGLFSAQRRYAEAIAIADQIRPFIRDHWQRLEFEVEALAPRAALLTASKSRRYYIEANKSFMSAYSLDAMPEIEQIRYCDSISDFISASPSILYESNINIAGNICLNILSKNRNFSTKYTTIMSDYFNFFLSERNIKYAEDIQRIYNHNITRFPNLSEFKSLHEILKLQSALQQFSLRKSEGLSASIKPNTSTADAANELAIAAEELLIRLAGEQNSMTEELIFTKGMLLAAKDDWKGARQAMEAALTKSPGPLPQRLGTDETPWLNRSKALAGLALICLRLKDLGCSDTAMAQTADILRSLQMLHPIDNGDLFTETHPRVYADLMEAALIRARVRSAHGQDEDADRILMSVVARLEPFMDRTVYGPSWIPFQARALAFSGTLRGRQGKLDDARKQFILARDLATARAVQEPRFFLWTELALVSRLRLAQLDSNKREIAATRDEIDQLTKAGKIFTEHDLSGGNDVRSWKLGSDAMLLN